MASTKTNPETNKNTITEVKPKAVAKKAVAQEVVAKKTVAKKTPTKAVVAPQPTQADKIPTSLLLITVFQSIIALLFFVISLNA